jgi:hypothetical protein
VPCVHAWAVRLASDQIDRQVEEIVLVLDDSGEG